MVCVNFTISNTDPMDQLSSSFRWMKSFETIHVAGSFAFGACAWFVVRDVNDAVSSVIFAWQ